MKKALVLLLTLTLLSSLLPATVFAETETSTESITEQGEGLFHIDPKITHPDDYMNIVGFELSIKRLEEGSLGGIMPISALMVTRGSHSVEDFAMDYSSGIPNYVGTAKELVTFNDSYLGTMFFANALEITLGEDEVIASFEGDKAIFSEQTTTLTAMSIFGKFEVSDVTWIIGEPEGSYDDEEAWEYVETIKYEDIATVENGSEYNYIDIEVPAEGEGPFPVILWIHGGGWQSLSRKSVFIPDTINYLISKGYAVVSAEYTLSKTVGEGIIEGGYPQMIYDLKAAVRYLRANAETYNLDTSFIAAMGESAGGHLAMLLGTSNGSEAHEDLSMGNEEYSSAVQLMVSYFGPSHVKDLFALAALGTENVANEQLIELASPYLQINADAPPLYLTHGENDMTVGINESYIMEEKARQLLGEENVTTLYYEHGPHASKGVFDTKLARESVEAFITTHYTNFKNTPSTPPSEEPNNPPSEQTSTPPSEEPSNPPSEQSSPTPIPISALNVKIEDAVTLTMVEETVAKFHDINADDWYTNYIAWANGQKLLNGVGQAKFAPKANASHAMIALTLSKLFGVDLRSYQVSDGTWYTASYNWATQAGLINGATSSPNDSIERAQLATIIHKLLNQYSIHLPVTEQEVAFTDEALMSEEEMLVFQRLYKLGVFIGDGEGAMNPRGLLTRAELAAVLFRVSNILDQISK